MTQHDTTRQPFGCSHLRLAALRMLSAEHRVTSEHMQWSHYMATPAVCCHGEPEPRLSVWQAVAAENRSNTHVHGAHSVPYAARATRMCLSGPSHPLLLYKNT
jgi:hypothetical protein